MFRLCGERYVTCFCVGWSVFVAAAAGPASIGGSTYFNPARGRRFHCIINSKAYLKLRLWHGFKKTPNKKYIYIYIFFLFVCYFVFCIFKKMNVVFFENKALIMLQSLVWRRWRTLSEVQMSSLQPTGPVRPAAAVGSAGVFFQRRRWASAAHRIMYGQCVGWKSSLFSSAGSPNVWQKKKG